MSLGDLMVIVAPIAFAGILRGMPCGDDVLGPTIDQEEVMMEVATGQTADVGSGMRDAVALGQLSRSEATRNVARNLGLKDLGGVSVQATRERFPDGVVPSLGQNLAGRTAWKVSFEGVDLAKACAEPALRNRHIRRITAYLSPESGQVVSVLSEWPTEVARTADYPPVESEERQLKAAGVTYTGLPTEAPAVSLFEALANEDVVFWSPDVKQIRACYVRETSPTHSDRPVWVVQLWGFEPFEVSAPRGVGRDAVPEDARNHIRNVIDARTGEWLGADTIPQPVTPQEQPDRRRAGDPMRG